MKECEFQAHVQDTEQKDRRNVLANSGLVIPSAAAIQRKM
jgi:hypothetical protein